MPRRYINYILLLVIIILFINIIRSWFLHRKRIEIVKETEDRLEQLKKEKDGLERELARVEDSKFVEREARNRLNLGKEDEVVVILPSISPIIELTPTPTEIPTNWEKWLLEFK